MARLLLTQCTMQVDRIFVTVMVALGGMASFSTLGGSMDQAVRGDIKAWLCENDRCPD